MVENGTVEKETTVTSNKSNGLVVDTSVLPTNCLPLTHQVAGHFFGKGRTKLGNENIFSEIYLFLFSLYKVQ